MIDQTYAGMMARYYDELYKEKPYKAEAAFIHERIQQHLKGTNLTMLELACGTGTHSILLSEYGYNILATDRSQDFFGYRKAESKVAQFAIQVYGYAFSLGTGEIRCSNLSLRFHRISVNQ